MKILIASIYFIQGVFLFISERLVPDLIPSFLVQFRSSTPHSLQKIRCYRNENLLWRCGFSELYRRQLCKQRVFWKLRFWRRNFCFMSGCFGSYLRFQLKFWYGIGFVGKRRWFSFNNFVFRFEMARNYRENSQIQKQKTDKHKRIWQTARENPTF